MTSAGGGPCHPSHSPSSPSPASSARSYPEVREGRFDAVRMTEASRKKKAASQAKWQAAHPEKAAAWNAAYRAANPEKVAAYNAAHYAAHREEVAARDAARYASDKGKAASRARASRRRAWKVGATIGAPFANGDVFARDGWTCGVCGLAVDRELVHPDPMSVSLDHVIPLSRGGEHSAQNTQCAHLICNKKKGARAYAA